MDLIISGFSDEISADLDTQIKVVKRLGMKYISLRGVDEKNISKYSFEEFKEKVFPRLKKEDINVSSIGSPIGKIFIDDEKAFEEQLLELEELCKIANLLDCEYIRMFSFHIKEDEDFDKYKDKVIEKLKVFIEIAKKYNVVLIHENEKGIFGDIARRCETLFEELYSQHFKCAFDFANFVQCGENPENAYKMLEKYIAYIHIKDAKFDSKINVLFGTGDGKGEEILRDAIKKGYKGFLTLEPHLTYFASLKDIEKEEDVVQNDEKITGEKGYEMQFNALNDILSKIV